MKENVVISHNRGLGDYILLMVRLITCLSVLKTFTISAYVILETSLKILNTCTEILTIFI